MRQFFFGLFLLFSFHLYGQTGNYFLSHYSPVIDRFDNVCFDIVQEKKGLIYFATRSGVIEFDGRDWNLIPSNGAVYSLQVSSSNEIFWGGARGFGKIVEEPSGERKLLVLAEGVQNVFQTLSLDQQMYYLSDEGVYTLDPEGKLIAVKSNADTAPLKNMFELFGKLYVTTEDKEILSLNNNKLSKSSLKLPYEEEIVFSAGLKNQYIIGLGNNKILTCGPDLVFHEIQLQEQGYADASVVVSGKWVNDKMFVLGTLRGGLMFIEVGTGKTQIVNYNTGLPDNEVYALMTDRSECIWAAHEYGFTRIAPQLPLRSFSHYNGLQGNLLCALSLNNEVYVGTSLGLFKLEKEDVYEDLVYYVEEEIKKPVTKKATPKKQSEAPVVEPPPVVTEPAPQQPEQSKRKGLFSFLRRKNKEGKTDKPATSTSPVIEEEKVVTQQPEEKDEEPQHITTTRKVKKTERVLRKSQYVFKKVKGVEAKVTQLIEADGKLVAAGLGGTYEVSGLTATEILEEPTRFVYISPENLLCVSTYSDQIKTFTNNGTNWKLANLLQSLDDQVTFIFGGAADELWLCGLAKIYKLSLRNLEVKAIEAFNIDNPNFNEFVGIHFKENVILANREGFFKFNSSKAGFETIDSLSGKLLNNFAVGNNIWYRNIHGWGQVNETTNNNNLRLLNLFQTLRTVLPDENENNFWVITRNNELYRFLGEQFIPYESDFPVFLKKVKNTDGSISSRAQLNFDQEASSLRFEVVLPDYIASQAIEYRYQLSGLEETWTDWSSTNNKIDFPYLPSGDYILKVQAKDIFGRIQEMPYVPFKITPPYWQTSWFYAMEFSIFTGLVMLSFRLSTRYRFISHILMLLTIIMLIQLIQTIIEQTFETGASPVVDFFIQVSVALLILPVESFLRRLMIRSLNSPTRLYKFLSPKANVDSTAGEQEQ